jgi:L-gulonolactone oxidase
LGVTQQTVAGAVSTSTHGGSLEIGSVSDQVESLRLVRADGQVVEIDGTSDLFPAATVSLGLLGIISTVTFRCVPAFTLQSKHGEESAAGAR